MLEVQTVADLAKRIGCEHGYLIDLSRRINGLVDPLDIRSPKNPQKIRRVYSPRPPLRAIQSALYRKVLLPALPRSKYSHGGIPGRSIRTNAAAHRGQRFAFTTDISDFFPSIRATRIHAFFTRFGCSSEVSGVCTRLCTFDDRLAQGFITSSMLADQLMIPADKEIGGVCEKLKLTYSRYVDDISVSGPFNFKRSGIPNLVRRILKCHGFRVKKEKEQFGLLVDGKICVTKVRVRGRRLDVEGTYVNELVRQLKDHASLAQGEDFDGPFRTPDQLWGSVEFVSWINPRRRHSLFGLLKRIDWVSAHKEAINRSIITGASLFADGGTG